MTLWEAEAELGMGQLKANTTLTVSKDQCSLDVQQGLQIGHLQLAALIVFGSILRLILTGVPGLLPVPAS